MTATPGIAAAAVVIVAVIAATVAVCLGQIDGAAYTGLVAALAGFGAGAGSHAAGVKQGQP